MRDLVIMPAMAQRRESLNMGEFAEEAIIVEEVAAPKRVNHFIEANTQEVTLQHLQQDCIIPSFASMEETISHQSFIGAVVDAAKDYFHGEQFDMPEIRISHPINGRIPSALGKKASELTDEEKTLFYQRMCFCFEIPSIVHDEYGNRLALSIGGVRAYNEINLYSKKSVERFKIFIGFRNRVCSNLMLTTDGLQDKIEVLSVQELYAAALNLFHAYNPSKDLHLLRTLGQMSISTSEDSTPLRVCRNQRILIHKTFEGLAERGKCSMGWSFGFKLHLIINDKGEILNFMFTPGNVDDREPLKQGKFLENIKGKLCADKGYIGQALFENPFLNGIQLVTKVKNNMKNSLMSIADKILLRKRALIETVNDELKNIEQREKSLPLIRITPIQRKAKMTLKMIHLNTSLTDICSLLIIQLIGEKRIPFTLLLR